MVIKQIRRVSLWEKDAITPLLSGISVAPGSAEYEDLGKQLSSSPTKDYCAIGLPMFSPTQPSTMTEMQCSYCKATFTTRQEQVEHYRLDWHRCNLQRSISGKAPLTEEQFVADLSDVSSISGSEDENSDDDAENTQGDDEVNSHVLRRQARLFFLNADGLVISLHRAVLFSKKWQMEGEQDAVQRVQGISGKQLWAVILLGGGHFAAGIFNGNEVVLHKTFHNYTVRSKQGGSQSSKDNQSATSHPKSGGASLRRYNELSQRQHIQELMESWKPHLARCNLIFYHAKHHNRNTLFSGKNCILNGHDNRLRTIPFPTKRAKFSEVKRVYGLLSEVLVHGTAEEFQNMIKESTDKEVKPVVKKKKDSLSQKPTRKPKSEKGDNLIFSSASSSEETEGDSDSEMLLMVTTMTLDTRDLGGAEGECSTNINKTRRQARRRRVVNHAGNTSNRQGNHQKTQLYDVLYTACRTGNLEHMATLLKKPYAQESQENSLSTKIIHLLESEGLPEDLTQITFGSRGRTLLHVAAENNQKDVVWWLMDNGCDPSVSDHQGLVPYSTIKNKDTRNQFRKFMALHPEKFDYKKANVPSPLTQEEEEKQAAILAKRKKAKKQAQQEKQKKRQEEEKAKKKEEEEKKRFLELSDREKRALAAERRMLQQQEQAAPFQVLHRCFLCAGDISGMVPFEYNEFKFCSTKCVREHRTKKT